MKNRLLVPTMLLAMAALTFAGTDGQIAADDEAGTRSWVRRTLKRNWHDQYSPMQDSFYMHLSRRVRDQHGRERTEYFSAYIRVDVRVSGGRLRTGEIEEFELEARSYGQIGNDPQVELTLRSTSGYHHYFRERKTFIVRGNGMTWERFDVWAGARMRAPAPSTVDQMSVSLTTTEAPVTFRWRDYGASDNAGSTAEFRFRVGRVRTMGSDVVVASGELGAQAEVTLTRDGQFSEGAEEWFQEGEKYRLVLWMRRIGSDVYSEDWGAAEWGTFTFRQGEGMLDSPGDPAPVPLPEQEKFDRLYSSR